MKTRKLLALVLALVSMFVMALPMTASAAGENAQITIIPPTSLTLTASDFTAYKLFDVTVSADSVHYAYVPVAAVTAFLASPQNAGNKYGATPTAFRAFLEANPSAAVMTALTKDLKDSGKFTPVGTVSKSGNNVLIKNLDYGYYLVVGQGEAYPGAKGKVIAHSILTTVQAANTNINLKADAPAIDKKVWNDNYSTPKWDDWADVNIGDTVKFQHKSKVPDMTGYSSYTFIVHDKMSAGLSFNNDVAITVDGTAVPITHFAVATSGTGETKITITFIDFFNSYKAKVGKDIVITYTALLNKNAVINAPGNPNVVWLEYSNDPYNVGTPGTPGTPGNPGTPGTPGGTGETPEDKVVVYTLDLNLYKYTGTLGKSSEQALSNAKFNLKKSNGTIIKFVDLTNGNYRVATPAEITAGTNITEVVVSPTNGKIRFIGLDAGTYTLVETAAPAGFYALDYTLSLTISHTAGVQNPVNIKKVGGSAQDEICANVVNIYNGSGHKLPGTGGMGTTIFYVTSAIITIGLAVFFIIRKRRNTLNAE